MRWLFVVVISVCGQFAAAAEITVARTEAFQAGDRALGGCNIDLTGPIVPGDAARLEQAVASIADQLLDGTPYWGQSGDGFNLCLNSDGGNFGEGIALAQVIKSQHLSTVVKSDQKCISACAVAFFGGSIFVDGSFKHRMAEPGAVIGVHAPALDLGTSDALVPVSVAGAAYVSAVADIQSLSETLLEEQGTAAGMPVSLFVRMVSTPPTEVFYVETVRQYAEWEILVAGGNASVPLNKTTLANACSALLSTEQHGDDFSMIASFAFNEPDFSMVSISQVNDNRSVRNEEVWEFSDIATAGVARETGCRFFISNGAAEIRQDTVRASVYWSNLDQERFYDGVSPLLALPNNAKVAEVFAKAL